MQGNEMTIPDGLMNFLIFIAVIYSVQIAISLAYLVLEILRNGSDHEEADDITRESSQ